METRLGRAETDARNPPGPAFEPFDRRRSDGRGAEHELDLFHRAAEAPFVNGQCAGFQKVLQIVEVPRDRRGDAPALPIFGALRNGLPVERPVPGEEENFRVRTPDEHVGNGRRIRVMQRIDEQEERPLAGRSLSGVIEKKVLPERRVVVLVTSVGQARPLGVSRRPGREDDDPVVGARQIAQKFVLRHRRLFGKARDVVVGHFGKARRELRSEVPQIGRHLGRGQFEEGRVVKHQAAFGESDLVGHLLDAVRLPVHRDGNGADHRRAEAEHHILGRVLPVRADERVALAEAESPQHGRRATRHIPERSARP